MQQEEKSNYQSSRIKFSQNDWDKTPLLAKLSAKEFWYLGTWWKEEHMTTANS